MKKIYLILLLFSFLIGQAQKSAPIAGDAATLIDLLKKDYNTVNPDNRDEEISMDRKKVISIFKSYLEEEKKGSLKFSPAVTQKLKKAYEDYIQSKETINLLSKANINVQLQNISNPVNANLLNTNDQFSEIKKQLSKSQSEFIELKKEYYKLKFDYDITEITSLKGAYISNNYITKILEFFEIKYENLHNQSIDNYAENNSFTSIQKSIPFFGGDLAFETIIDGLSRFLAKRIKEELTVYAIDKIKTYLENPTPENYCNELLVLLPTTTNYLKSFDAEQLMNFTDEMKQYIEQDLNSLLENAVHLKDTPRLKSYIEKNPDLEFAFEGLEIIPQLSKIKSPIDYFEILENSRSLVRWRENPADKKRYNIAQSIRLASMIAYSMTVVDNGETKFASVDLLSNYGNERNFYFLYFGLLHQQNIKYFNIDFIPQNSTTPQLFDLNAMMNNPSLSYGNINNTTANFKFLKSNLIAVATNAEKIYNQALTLKKKNKNNEEVKYEEIYSFIDDFLSFAKEITTTADGLLDTKYMIFTSSIKDDVNLETQLTPYFNVAHIANTMMLDLHQKKYANAIIKAIEIPLNFRNYKNEEFSKNLLSFSNQIKNNSDLKAFHDLINEDKFNELSHKEKIALLNDIQTKFQIISIKLIGSNPTLLALKITIDQLNITTGSITNNNKIDLKKLSNDRATIKGLFTPILIDALLEYVGISKGSIKEAIDKQLIKNHFNNNIQIQINTLVSNYLDSVFNNYVLNQTMDLNTLKLNMETIIKEFIPQFIEQNSKLNDNKAIKIIHFINEMASAKDAEGVEKAIDAFALPAGSSSLKEKATHYISINAFPGLIGGFEFAKNEERATAFGITAPVGLYGQFMSWGKGCSLGVFIPIIDIGAPVRLRIDNKNDTKTLPDFNFSDIFSPGFYLSLGFGGKSPFALNIGAQYGPKLRDFNDGVTDIESVDSYRVSAALVIDIPLLTLSSKYRD